MIKRIRVDASLELCNCGSIAERLLRTGGRSAAHDSCKAEHTCQRDRLHGDTAVSAINKRRECFLETHVSTRFPSHRWEAVGAGLGELLVLQAVRHPWRGLESIWLNRLSINDTRTETAVFNAPECVPHLR